MERSPPLLLLCLASLCSSFFLNQPQARATNGKERRLERLSIKSARCSVADYRDEKGEKKKARKARLAVLREMRGEGSGRFQLHDVPLIMQHRWTGHGQFVGGKQRV